MATSCAQSYPRFRGGHIALFCCHFGMDKTILLDDRPNNLAIRLEADASERAHNTVNFIRFAVLALGSDRRSAFAFDPSEGRN